MSGKCDFARDSHVQVRGHEDCAQLDPPRARHQPGSQTSPGPHHRRKDRHPLVRPFTLYLSPCADHVTQTPETRHRSLKSVRGPQGMGPGRGRRPRGKHSRCHPPRRSHEVHRTFSPHPPPSSPTSHPLYPSMPPTATLCENSSSPSEPAKRTSTS